jgi:hypothetical protein
MNASLNIETVYRFSSDTNNTVAEARKLLCKDNHILNNEYDITAAEVLPKGCNSVMAY